MRSDNEIRSENNVFFGEVLGFDEKGDILIRNHGRHGKSDIMTLNQINKKAYETATRMKYMISTATISER